MENLEIKIVGTTNSGKSIVSQVINQALIDAGFNNVNLIDNDGIGLYYDLDERVNGLVKRNNGINISQVQTPRKLRK